MAMAALCGVALCGASQGHGYDYNMAPPQVQSSLFARSPASITESIAQGFPRIIIWRGSEEGPREFEPTNSDYFSGLSFMAVPGMATAALLLIFFVSYLIVSTCKGFCFRCAKRKREKKEKRRNNIEARTGIKMKANRKYTLRERGHFTVALFATFVLFSVGLFLTSLASNSVRERGSDIISVPFAFVEDLQQDIDSAITLLENINSRVSTVSPIASVSVLEDASAEVGDVVLDALSDVEDARSQYDDMRHLYTLIVFGIGTAITFLMYLAAYFKWAKVMRIFLTMLLFIGIIFGLLAAVHLPIGVLVTDMCAWLNVFDDPLTDVFGLQPFRDCITSNLVQDSGIVAGLEAHETVMGVNVDALLVARGSTLTIDFVGEFVGEVGSRDRFNSMIVSYELSRVDAFGTFTLMTLDETTTLPSHIQSGVLGSQLDTVDDSTNLLSIFNDWAECNYVDDTLDRVLVLCGTNGLGDAMTRLFLYAEIISFSIVVLFPYVVLRKRMLFRRNWVRAVHPTSFDDEVGIEVKKATELDYYGTHVYRY